MLLRIRPASLRFLSSPNQGGGLLSLSAEAQDFSAFFEQEGFVNHTWGFTEAP